MSIGTYGITRPSDVSIEDIDVYYTYTSSRDTFNNQLIKIEDATEIIDYCYNTIDNNSVEVEGLYNITLPSEIFNEIGFYTVYLKPKTIEVDVVECGSIITIPNLLGIVISSDSLNSNPELMNNNALQGYRVEYIDQDGNKIRNLVRYVVSSNRVKKETVVVTSPYQTTNAYSFDDSSNFIFLQLTPSSSYDIKPNTKPFIGDVGYKLLLSNTHFNPIMIEVEMVENTLDTLTELVAGEQIKDVQKGIVTHFDANRNITRQFDIFEIKDDFSDTSLHEVRERRTNIDTSQTIDDVTSGLT